MSLRLRAQIALLGLLPFMVGCPKKSQPVQPQAKASTPEPTMKDLTSSAVTTTPNSQIRTISAPDPDVSKVFANGKNRTSPKFRKDNNRPNHNDIRLHKSKKSTGDRPIYDPARQFETSMMVLNSSINTAINQKRQNRQLGLRMPLSGQGVYSGFSSAISSFSAFKPTNKQELATKKRFTQDLAKAFNRAKQEGLLTAQQESAIIANLRAAGVTVR